MRTIVLDQDVDHLVLTNKQTKKPPPLEGQTARREGLNTYVDLSANGVTHSTLEIVFGL